ncbi:transcriptional regulator [[Bacillus thuringiensis] serovar konkukian]|nr:helix-turn-helix transcriptional regulator [Bacillus thuringiensis]MED1303679.1 helix-turn-helix transcriptional regulator [Bacillus pacificus]OUA94864.1 transcriptional regulator [[Bacillus thuringiensis] serovar konkukian]
MLPILSIRIKELRKERKWSQKELGEKVEVSESFVSKVESGKKQPSREVTTKIAEVLNVTTDYLLGRTEDGRLTKEQEDKATEMAKRLEKLIANLEEAEQDQAFEHLEMFVQYQKSKNNSK